MNIDAEEFVKHNFKMLTDMETFFKVKKCIVAPYASSEDGFSSMRFIGRYLGFYHAAWNDVRNPRMIQKKTGPKENDFQIFLTAFTEEESVAIEKLMEKIKNSSSSSQSIDIFKLGLWEGITILVHKEDLTLLYTETNVDINKGCPNCHLPSYELSRLTRIANNLIANRRLSVDDTVEILQKEGAGIMEARAIVELSIKATIQDKDKLWKKGVTYYLLLFVFLLTQL